MIDFRYHLVSIVAVFLALAVGIVLGSTELQGNALDVLQSTSDSLRSQLSAASTERDTYQAQASAAQQFLQTAEPVLLAGRLAGKRVVVIAEPGSAPGVVSGVRQAAASAGATVTGQVDLQPKFNDVSGATQSTLGAINDSMAGDNNVTLAPAAAAQTAYQQQAAQLIALAILTKTDNSNKHGSAASSGSSAAAGESAAGPAGGGLSAASAQTLLSAYAQSGFITVSGAPADRATLALVVVPAAAPAGGQNDPVNQVLLAAVQEFAEASEATVAVGATAGSAASGSSIAVLRASSVSAQVSTVDNADTGLGQISAIQALAAQLAGSKPNSYGVSNAAAVSPSPMPSPLVTGTASPQHSQTGKANK